MSGGVCDQGGGGEGGKWCDQGGVHPVDLEAPPVNRMTDRQV